MKKIYKDIAVFVGGTLFGSAGIKLLSSKDAKNVYTHAAAAVLRMKDTVMNTVDCVKENAGDILASAEEINEKRAAEAEAAATGGTCCKPFRSRPKVPVRKLSPS